MSDNVPERHPTRATDGWVVARQALDVLEARHGLGWKNSDDLGPVLYSEMLAWCRGHVPDGEKRPCLICQLGDPGEDVKPRTGWWEPTGLGDVLGPIWVCWEHESFCWRLTLTPAPPTLPGIGGPAWIETWRREIWEVDHINPYPPPPEIRPYHQQEGLAA